MNPVPKGLKPGASPLPNPPISVKILNQVNGDNFVAYHGDSCEIIQAIPDNSIHYSIQSPPFSSLYVYSASARDMGNSRSDSEFWEHYKFLIREQFRVLKPGRNISIHCMDLPTSKTMHGVIGLRDFRGDVIAAYVDDEAKDFYAAIARLKQRSFESFHNGDERRSQKLDEMIVDMETELSNYPGRTGFVYHSAVTIRKDPVQAMQRTKALGLLHKQLVKDSAMSRQGIPDYLLTFRKPGTNDEPIAGMLETYHGTDVFRADDKTRKSVEIWQRYAEPIWMDVETDFAAIVETLTPEQLEFFTQFATMQTSDPTHRLWDDILPADTLNGERGRRAARSVEDEAHICPLQLSVIRRAIQLWSSPGDVVMTNFGGIGSEAYVALQEGRKAILMELKDSYFRQAVKNLQEVESNQQIALFNLDHIA